MSSSRPYLKPWDELSKTTCSIPAVTQLRSIVKSSIGSGVVSTDSSLLNPSNSTIDEIIPAGANPRFFNQASKISLRQLTVVDLPLVPVTPIIESSCCGHSKYLCAQTVKARRILLTIMPGISTLRSFSAKYAVAPKSIASSKYWRLKFFPLHRKKVFSTTLRES